MDHLLIIPDENGVQKAANLIRTGGLVAFPTETVYGLGANALNEDAVKSIFVAKGRPLTDPLIVHIAETNQVYELVELNSAELLLFDTLVSSFWPGPLTLIVKASPKIPLLVTADTGFVGVRRPNHPLAVKLLVAAGLPIAAPSANRFGHVSPTTALHVLADLGVKGVHILNGEYNTPESFSDSGDVISTKYENCEFGIESSVVKIDSANQQLIIFRQGAISQHQLEQCLRSVGCTWKVVAVQRAVKMHSTEQQESISSGSHQTDQTAHRDHPSESDHSNMLQKDIEQEIAAGQQAPGQAITHYAPDVPCFIVNSLKYHSDDVLTLSPGSSSQILVLTPSELSTGSVIIDYNGSMSALKDSVLAYRDLSCQGSAAEAARSLFDTLRWSEGIPGATRVLIAAVPLPSVCNDAELSGDFTVSDMTLGLVDRIFRAASGVCVDLVLL